MPENINERLTRIDGLRGLAIIGVILVHVAIISSEKASNFIMLGQYGVQLFFLLSGFILTYVASKNNFDIKSFYIKRFFRIAPLYYLFLAGCFFLNFSEQMEPGALKVSSIDIKNLFMHVIFLHGINPVYLRGTFSIMWSLTPEVIFYILFPFIFNLSTFSLGFLFFGSVLIANLTNVFNNPNIYNHDFIMWITHGIQNNLFLFVFGVMVYKYQEFFKRKIWTILGIISLILFIMDGFSFNNFFIDIIIPKILYNKYFALIMLAFPFFIYSQNFIIKKLLNNKISTFLGRISYSAFLVHYAIIQFLRTQEYVHKYLFTALLVVFLTVLLSYITYKFIEKPGIRFGNRLINWIIK
jgi:peptidoglycan/LPS O-acetylase OafA/YrhL